MRSLAILVADVVLFVALFAAGVALPARLHLPGWLGPICFVPPLAYAWVRGALAKSTAVVFLVFIAMCVGIALARARFQTLNDPWSWRVVGAILVVVFLIVLQRVRSPRRG